MFGKPQHTSLEETGTPTREKTPYVAWRLWTLAILGVLVIGVFGVRIYYLTVLRNPYFYELSENNYLFEQPVSAPRGKIMTSDGATVALNRTLYDIEMSPFGMDRKSIIETVERLADLMQRPELKKKAQGVMSLRPKWKRLTLARDLDLQAVAPVLERTYELPGVLIEPRYSRHYPYGRLLAHVTGHVGAITPNQVGDYTQMGYLRTDKVGKIGAERQYEDVLKGVHGTELCIRDAQGRPRSNRIETAAMRGNDVVLTIDLRLQTIADGLMADHHGVAIVMKPRDGSILALVSKPDYDPNDPLGGLAGKSSSYNKVVRGLFAPASTFKLVTAAAGLMQGRPPEERYTCNGQYQLSIFKKPFNCDLRSGHGTLDLYGAIQKSCNVFFFHWADQLGRDRMIDMGTAFGFGQPTGIDLVPEGLEAVGILGRPNQKNIYRGSVIQMGIGQGSLIAVTPIQLLCAYTALANGGTRYRPHLFKEERSPMGDVAGRYEPETLGQLPLTKGQRQVLIEGFRRVVQSQGGTAYNTGFDHKWNAAGKTGSAEIAGQELTNGWFVTFAPMDDPEVSILVLIEAEGHGGVVAAPIASEIMRAYFERTNRAQLAAGN